MNIPEDKVLHFCAGIGIAVLMLAIGGTPLIGFIASVIVGVAKEVIWDKALGRGQLDWWDAAATAMGGALLSLGALIQ